MIRKIIKVVKRERQTGTKHYKKKSREQPKNKEKWTE